ncbi:hypothetical protein WJX82_005443 [Trebouxia sp. C0006]
MTKTKQQTSSTAPSSAGSPPVLTTQSKATKLSKPGKSVYRKRAKVEEAAQPISPESPKAVPGHIAAGEIDDIFKQVRAKTQSTAKPAKKVKLAPKPAAFQGSKDDIFGTGQPKQRRFDAEGLPVYTADELNVGAGGETDQCPFDCTCCF